MLTDAERNALAATSAKMWAAIREAAQCAFDDHSRYRYHDGSMTHDCATIDDLARVTRHERRRAAVRWPEDR